MNREFFSLSITETPYSRYKAKVQILSIGLSIILTGYQNFNDNNIHTLHIGGMYTKNIFSLIQINFKKILFIG